MLQVWRWWESLPGGRREIAIETVHQFVNEGDRVPTMKELVNAIQRRLLKPVATGTDALQRRVSD